MSDMRAPHWEDHEEQFRAEWQRRYPNVPWNDVRLGYRYGWEQARRPDYNERQWAGVERELQARWSEWQARYGSSSGQGRQLIQNWDDLKGSVQYGWEQARMPKRRARQRK